MRVTGDRGDDLGMALAAPPLGDGAIARRDLDRIGERPGREIERVPEAVQRLSVILAARLWGVWQSLQTAPPWWPPVSQPSYWVFIMWQLAHAAGSFVR